MTTAEGGNAAWVALVGQCGDFLHELAHAHVVLQEDLGLVPVEDSPYAADLAAAKESSELLHARSLDVGSTLMSKALVGYGHLYAMADSIGGPGAIFAPWTLLRSVVETLGFGVWILKGDSLAQRVHRTMTERLHGIYENRKLGNDAGIEELVNDANERIERIRADVEELGYDFQRPKRAAPYVVERRLAAVRAAGILFGDEHTGTLIYRRASQYGHGMMAAVVTQLGEETENAPDRVGVQERQPQTTAAQVVRVTRWAIAAGLHGLGPIYEYVGYAGDTWKHTASTVWTGIQELAAEFGLDEIDEDLQIDSLSRPVG